VRSIFGKILVWCFGTLVIALGVYVLISAVFSSHIAGKGGPFEKTVAFQVAEAEEAYQRGGSAALAAYLRKLQTYFGPEHYFTDPQGHDLATGADRSALLRAARSQGHLPPEFKGQHRFVFVTSTADGRYRLIATGKLPFSIWSFLPYYGLILLVVGFLCWLLAINLASPLRKLARTVERFGHGDLAARAGFRRRDEIGEVACAFDQMADRIETLLTAERRLLQDISHELRSPLARLSFAAELARTAPDRDAATARIRKEIDRLTNLVGALLQVTRVEGDPSSRNLENIDLSRLVQELLEESRVEADARGCRFEVATNGGLTLRGDRELLRRAVENIVRNAIRYAPEGSPIDVTLESRAGKALLTVRDYGRGVADEMLGKIFQPFYRADDSRGADTGGVGLGLSIAQRAVIAHHGWLAAENAAPGLRVIMELPLNSN
jgi:signal transduction histidine kinase